MNTWTISTNKIFTDIKNKEKVPSHSKNVIKQWKVEYLEMF